MTKVFAVQAVKGGVGKTFVTMAVMHCLLERQRNVMLIEADAGNPDVAKLFMNKTAHEDNVKIETIKLSTAEGWADLINAVHETERYVVINSPAANGDALRRYGRRFWRGMHELKRPVVTLWVINRDYDSVLQLRDYLDLTDKVVPAKEKHVHRLHVVKNLAKSEDERFPTYDASEVKRRVEEAGGLSVGFPIMALRNRERLYDQRQTIREVLDTAPFGCGFRSNPITESGASRSLIPIQADHRFRSQADHFSAVTGMVQGVWSEGARGAG